MGNGWCCVALHRTAGDELLRKHMRRSCAHSRTLNYVRHNGAWTRTIITPTPSLRTGDRGPGSGYKEEEKTKEGCEKLVWEGGVQRGCDTRGGGMANNEERHTSP